MPQNYNTETGEHKSPLAARIAEARAAGMTLSDATVLAAQRDPYRLDTKTHWRNAEWLADAIAQVGVVDPIHLRGLHYRLVGSVALPDGKPYTNTDATWKFLSEQAAVAGRFLGTVDFSLIRDNRNDPPTIWTPESEGLRGMIDGGFKLELPSADKLVPRPVLKGTASRQAWRLAIIGEKSGLYDLVEPIAERYEATLALPNGEISTSMCEQLIADAAGDGRPLAAIYLADLDPAGWQMAVSFARKAQAIVDLRYPEVRLRVHPVALTPDQARDWALPSTPLKATEQRADRWKDAMGAEQTEIDAAVGRAPDALSRVVDTACRAYWDSTTWTRGREARNRWEAEAAGALENQLGAETLERIAGEVATKMSEAKTLITEINTACRIDPAELGITLPAPPEPAIGTAEGGSLPMLIDTADGFVAITAALKQRKSY